MFFDWLSEQSGYKSKINKTVIDYLNLTKGEIKIATQPRMRPCPTLEEVKALIESIRGKTEIEMRDKALISLTFLTGARISAVSTLPIRSFDREKLIIDQDPKLGVKTKNSKIIPSVKKTTPALASTPTPAPKKKAPARKSKPKVEVGFARGKRKEAVARAVADADYVIENGAGYDSWMDKLVGAGAGSNADRKVLNVATLELLS